MTFQFVPPKKPSVAACINPKCLSLQKRSFETCAGTRERWMCCYPGEPERIPGNLYRCPRQGVYRCDSGLPPAAVIDDDDQAYRKAHLARLRAAGLSDEDMEELGFDTEVDRTRED